MARAIAVNRTIKDLKNQEANSATMSSSEFKKACENAGLAPNTRQARKFRSKRGKAFAASQKPQKGQLGYVEAEASKVGL